MCCGLVNCAFRAALSAANLAKSNVPTFSFPGVPSAFRLPDIWPSVAPFLESPTVVVEEEEEEVEEEEVEEEEEEGC